MLGAERKAPKYVSAFVKAALRIGTLCGMSRLKFYEKSIETTTDRSMSASNADLSNNDV